MRQKKRLRIPVRLKILEAFFDTVVMHHKFFPEGKSMNYSHYLALLKHIRENVSRKDLRCGNNFCFLSTSDTVLAHRILLLTKSDFTCFLSYPNHLTFLLN